QLSKKMQVVVQNSVNQRLRIGSFWARRASPSSVVPSPDPSRRRTVGRGAQNATRFKEREREAPDDPVWREPITGITGCCARAIRGHAAAPPSSVRKSRRFNRFDCIRSSQTALIQVTRRPGLAETAAPQSQAPWPLVD